MVLPQGRRPAEVNAVIAQANVPLVPPVGGLAAKVGINIELAGVGVSVKPIPVPNVVAAQCHRLTRLTPLEVLTKIRFLIETARMLASPNNQNITFPSLGLRDIAEVKTLCAAMCKSGGGKQ
jgi:hypothetical protein